MDLTHAGPFLAANVQGVLMTLKRNGHPQASNIVYTYANGVARISVTAGRAKARNLSRDPRASLHVTSSDFGRFVVAEGTVDLSPVSTEPGDATGRELLDIYETIRRQPHPDHPEFFDAMVDDRRLVIRLNVDHVYGQLPG